MDADQMKRPMTPFFVFLKEKRKDINGLTSKEGGKLWAKLSSKEKGVYESQYREKKEEYEKYMESQGFKTRRASTTHKEKFSPMGKGIPDHIRSKRIRIACDNTKNVLPCSKAVYKGLSRALEIFIEGIGKSIERERKENWESVISIDLVCQAVTNDKTYNKITGM